MVIFSYLFGNEVVAKFGWEIKKERLVFVSLVAGWLVWLLYMCYMTSF